MYWKYRASVVSMALRHLFGNPTVHAATVVQFKQKAHVEQAITE
jgi:hypothetical protein